MALGWEITTLGRSGCTGRSGNTAHANPAAATASAPGPGHHRADPGSIPSTRSLWAVTDSSEIPLSLLSSMLRSPRSQLSARVGMQRPSPRAQPEPSRQMCHAGSRRRAAGDFEWLPKGQGGHTISCRHVSAQHKQQPAGHPAFSSRERSQLHLSLHPQLLG